MSIFTRLLLLSLILVSAGSPSDIAAQVVPGLGSRVRITNNNGDVILGTIQASSSADMTIAGEANGAEVRVPLRDIRRFEWNYGEKGNFLKYFVLGTLSVSAVVGVGAALITANECGDFLCSPAEAFVVGALAGSVIGIPVGVIAGLSAREALWLDVRLPESDLVTLSVSPIIQRRAGAAAAVSIRTR